MGITFRSAYSEQQFYLMWVFYVMKFNFVSRELFQANFRLNKITLKFVICFGWCLVGQKMQFWTCLFFINYFFFIYLKLKIGLEIPASNEWEILTNNFAVQEWSYKQNFKLILSTGFRRNTALQSVSFKYFHVCNVYFRWKSIQTTPVFCIIEWANEWMRRLQLINSAH